MADRLHRLLHGQTCKGCGRTRRVRWFSDTGCCSGSCLITALAAVELPTDGYPYSCTGAADCPSLKHIDGCYGAKHTTP